MEAVEKGFTYTHLSRQSCEHNGCFSINEDGSGYCFSCKEYVAEVENVEELAQGKQIRNVKVERSNVVESELEGMFGALTDRGISEETAKKFGVKIITNTQDKVVQHIYPYFTSN